MRDRSRSRDKHSSANKRRERSRSPRDRKPSAFNRNRDRDPKDRRKEAERHKRRDEEGPKNYRREESKQQKDTGRANGSSVAVMSSPPPPQPKVQTTVNPPPSDVPPKLSSIQLAAARAAALLPSTSNTDPAVDLPSYYNPAAINVAKYTSQIQKRKLLWSNKDAKPNADKWQQTAQFSKDEDGKVASKFMRLMGIKTAVSGDGGGEGSSAATATEKKPNEIAKKQADMFSTMEQQYEIARQATHTMRGMGLGFSRQY